MSDDAPLWLVWLEEQLDPNVQGTRTVLAELPGGLTALVHQPDSAWASRHVLKP